MCDVLAAALAAVDDGVEPYGGQAVVEGVMMRSPRRWAVAVRRPDDAVHVEAHDATAPGRAGWRSLPLVRGPVALVGALAVGLRALAISLAVRRGGEGTPAHDPAAEGDAARRVVGTFALLFVVVPLVLAVLLGVLLDLGWPGVALVDALARVAVLALQLRAAAVDGQVQRLFAYHGAEHQAVHAWEHGDVLSPDALAGRSVRHPRCGTTFLLDVVLVMGLLALPVTAAVGVAPTLGGWAPAQLLARLALVPVVAGIAFEVLRLGAGGGPLAPVLAAPGLALQRWSTRTPDASMQEVAVHALAAVLPDDAARGRVDGAALPSSVVRPPGAG